MGMIMNKIQKQWENILKKTYKAHIADVDGNLTKTTINASSLESDVISLIQKRLESGIPFGICSARSYADNPMLINIKNDVLGPLSNQAIKNFFIFPEQGALVICFSKNKKNEIITKEIDLVKYFKIKGAKNLFDTTSRKALFDEIVTSLGLQNTLQYIGDKRYGFIAQLKEKEIIIDAQHQDKILYLTKKMSSYVQKNHPLFEVLCTRKSIYVTLKGANKGLSLRYFAQKYHLELGEIVGTDDQGTFEGVGFPLICHEAGFSTNIYEKERTYPFPVSVIAKKSGVDAWLFLEEHLKYQPPFPLIDK